MKFRGTPKKKIHEVSWSTMGFHGFPWSVHRVPWKLYGVPWNSIGTPWSSMEIHGTPWTLHGNSMEFHGTPQTLDGIPWSSMDIPWSSMEFHGDILHGDIHSTPNYHYKQGTANHHFQKYQAFHCRKHGTICCNHHSRSSLQRLHHPLFGKFQGDLPAHTEDMYPSRCSVIYVFDLIFGWSWLLASLLPLLSFSLH